MKAKPLLVLKQAMFAWSVNQNLNRSLNKSIQILIGTRTNQSQFQSEYEQIMSRTITSWPVHEVDEPKA